MSWGRNVIEFFCFFSPRAIVLGSSRRMSKVASNFVPLAFFLPPWSIELHAKLRVLLRPRRCFVSRNRVNKCSFNQISASSGTKRDRGCPRLLEERLLIAASGKLPRGRHFSRISQNQTEERRWSRGGVRV